MIGLIYTFLLQMCKSVSYIDKRVILRYFCEITQPLPFLKLSRDLWISLQWFKFYWFKVHCLLFKYITEVSLLVLAKSNTLIYLLLQVTSSSFSTNILVLPCFHTSC